MSITAEERQVNLAICLLSVSEKRNRRGEIEKNYVPREFIYQNVEGYQEGSEDAIRRKFERDKERLRSLGWVIEQGPEDKPEDEQGYYLARSDVELAPIEFTPEEKVVLELASQVWVGQTTKEIAYTALNKMDLNPSAEAVSLFSTSGNDEDSYQDIAMAIWRGQGVSFKYKDKARKVFPWRLVNRWGAWYLIAMDLEKREKRLFRLSRIQDDIKSLSSADLKKFADLCVRPDSKQIDAAESEITGALKGSEIVIAVRDDFTTPFHVLEQLDIPVPKGYRAERVEIRTWQNWVNHFAAFGEKVLVIEPVALRQQLITHFEEIAKASVK